MQSKIDHRTAHWRGGCFRTTIRGFNDTSAPKANPPAIVYHRRNTERIVEAQEPPIQLPGDLSQAAAMGQNTPVALIVRLRRSKAAT